MLVLSALHSRLSGCCAAVEDLPARTERGSHAGARARCQAAVGLLMGREGSAAARPRLTG